MKPPCIRGLKQFEDGCPMRDFNGHDGCPAWIEDWVVERGERKIRKQCVDLWMKDYMRFSLGLLEGNQQATESNRNMTALFSLVSTGAKSPDELVRVATKNLEVSRDKLMIEAKGKNA